MQILLYLKIDQYYLYSDIQIDHLPNQLSSMPSCEVAEFHRFTNKSQVEWRLNR